MFLFLLTMGLIRCDGFILEHFIKNYTLLIQENVVTCLLCIGLSLFIMFRGSSNRMISLTVILSLLFTIFYEDLKIYLEGKCGTSTEFSSLDKESWYRKLFNCLYKIVLFGHKNAYLALGVFFVVSYALTRVADLSIVIYVAYLLAEAFDSFKSMYFKNYVWPSFWMILIVIILIAYKLASYLKIIIFSLFYSTIGVTLFLIGLEILFNWNMGFSTMYGDMFSGEEISKYVKCLITQTFLIFFSTLVQIKDSYLK